MRRRAIQSKVMMLAVRARIEGPVVVLKRAMRLVMGEIGLIHVEDGTSSASRMPAT